MSSRADADDRHAAREFREASFKFFLIKLGGRVLDLRANLRDARVDLLLVALAVDDHGRIFRRNNLTGATEHVERCVLELEADVFGNNLRADRRCNIREHFLLAVAVARGLDAEHVECAAELVEYEGRERLALHIFRNDDNILLAALRDFLEDRQHLLHR